MECISALRLEPTLPDIDALVQQIDHDLPEIARSVIRSRLDASQAANRAFAANPDARDQHQQDWHQWGIITHTRVFLKDFQVSVPQYLRRWGFWDPVDASLRCPIDGVSRWDLLRVAILLHDIGKFGARTMGRERFHFAHHEEVSGEIILEDLDLGQYGLTGAQIDYVAMTARDHFVLGLLRKKARQFGGYDGGFVQSEAFAEEVQRIKNRHPDDSIEVGVLFLGDSLAKARPPDGPRRAVDQYQINIDVAHRYLSIVLDRALSAEAE